MKENCFFASLTRISDLEEKPFSVGRISRREWETGDYVVGEVTSPSNGTPRIELSTGRMIEAVEGDRILGALGVRYATLESVGGWQGIGQDRMMEALTGAGLFGKATSRSAMLPSPISLLYKGHVLVNGEKSTMRSFVKPAPEKDFDLPVVLMVGTSMSAGKTTTAKVVVHQLKEAGLEVIGAKLAGAGRYRDILSMKDAGADHIFDFVDGGIPSTVLPASEYREILQGLLSRIAGVNADVLVAEVGASPLEPYNGATVIEELGENIRCTVLSASDPYAVTGVTQAFGIQPDLVTGLATGTQAGIELIEKLSGIQALNVLDRDSHPKLGTILKRMLK